MRLQKLARRMFSSTGRPPMPRVMPPPPPVGRLRRYWNDGTILLTVGYSGLFLMLVDQFLQYQQKKDAVDMVRAIELDSARRKRALLEAHRATPTLYRAKVIREYKQMGGSHGLEGLNMFDVVDVLEENVGPDHSYVLCRLTKNDVVRVGWFPTGFLKRVDKRKAGVLSWLSR